jgi:hypothetical protein
VFAGEVKDARVIFDDYIVRYSTLEEVVELLQYTYVYGSRCIGQVLRIKRQRSEGKCGIMWMKEQEIVMADKLKLVWVIGNEEGKTDKGKVILWERHPDHPNGEIVVVNDGRSYEVAETKAIKELIGQEVLLRSSARVNWNSKTEGGIGTQGGNHGSTGARLEDETPAKNKGGRPKGNGAPALRPSTDEEEDNAQPPLTGLVEKQTGRVPDRL